jgi:hypothetical protein
VELAVPVEAVAAVEAEKSQKKSLIKENLNM